MIGQAPNPYAVAADLLAEGDGWTPLSHQVPPPGRWKVWMLMAGRGSGKTEAGSRYVDAHARGLPCIEGPTPHRIAIIAPTLDDARKICVNGDSGLLQVNRSIDHRPGSTKQADLLWSNGSEARVFGAYHPKDVDRLRGPQHCLVWAEELAAWPQLDAAWDMMEFGLRLGEYPRVVVTTTPRPRAKVKELVKDPLTVVSRSSTKDNPYLPAHRRAELYAKYAGTRLGRQELDAEIIDDADGALWTRDMILYRPLPLIMREGVAVPDLARVVVGVDPAVTHGEGSDETGIVVDALGTDGMGYAIADVSGRLSPIEWARRAVAAYHTHRADRIVAEANNGGELVRTVIATVDKNVPVTLVHASRGKIRRAEPVSTLYIPSEHRAMRWYHAEPLPELEDQMCNYVGVKTANEQTDSSPDRMDAHVWAVTELAGLTDTGWAQGAWGGGQGSPGAIA